MIDTMNADQVYENLKELSTRNFDSNYSFLEQSSGVLYGIDKHGYFVYGIESTDLHKISQNQHTDLLLLKTNTKITLETSDDISEKYLHLLICSSFEVSDLKTFIRLTSAFNTTLATSDKIMNLFESLTKLFKNKGKVGTVVANGVFGELYVMYYFYARGLDIYPYWQKKSRMKFDFMFDNEKRMDVKTAEFKREHHFIHEQLDSDNYDITVCSILLRKNNSGITMDELIEFARLKYEGDYDHLLVLENIASKYSKKELQDYCFDKKYLEDNIKFYNAHDIPRIPSGTPDFVSKINYDSDLTAITPLGLEEIYNWIHSGIQQ